MPVRPSPLDQSFRAECQRIQRMVDQCMPHRVGLLECAQQVGLRSARRLQAKRAVWLAQEFSVLWNGRPLGWDYLGVE